MFETIRYETNRRVRSTVILSGAIGLYTAFVVWYFTALEGVNYEELLQQFPPTMIEAFGIESLSTSEGFLGAQLFNFVWLLGLGLYFAYSAGSLVAGDIEADRMDLLLSFPVSRSQLLIEKFGALLLPIVSLNVIVGIVIYVLSLAIGEPIAPVNLILVHLLSIPYLLVCAGIGVLFSVALDRAAVAERGAVGIVFGLFLVESVVGSSADLEWIQYITPTYYYEPTRLLISGSFRLVDVGVLLIVLVVLLVASQRLFQRRDI